VIPTANRPALLSRAVASCQGGDTEIEIVIVHDDPAADTKSGNADGLNPHPIVSIHHDRNRGPSAARNTGAAAATGAWILFLDDDDYLAPGSLRIVTERISSANEDVGVIAFSAQVLRSNHVETTTPRATVKKYGEPFWAEIGTLVIRKEFFDLVGGFDESMWIGENRDLVARLAASCQFEQYPDVIVALDYSHQLARASKHNKSLAANLLVLEKNSGIYGTNRLWWRSAHLYVASHAASQGDIVVAWQVYRRWSRSGLGSRGDLRFLGSLLVSGLVGLRSRGPRSSGPE
jgi:glycosyltransferase involved in cell wall biosynthesis